MDDIEILRPMNNKKFAGFPDFGAAALALYFPRRCSQLVTVGHRWSVITVMIMVRMMRSKSESLEDAVAGSVGSIEQS